MKIERLYCDRCGDGWDRVVKRGRKPLYCKSCEYYYGKPPVMNPRPVSSALVRSDGGQGEAGINDTNDCTVKALANATGRPYAEAHTFMSANGRKKGTGINFESTLSRNRNKALGHTFTITPTFARSRGIRTAVERNPQLRYGTWILKMRSHVAVLKDGKLFDSFDSSRKDVLYAWKVEEA